MSREITRESERRRIEKSFDVFGLGARDRGLILEALDSTGSRIATAARA